MVSSGELYIMQIRATYYLSTDSRLAHDSTLTINISPMTEHNTQHTRAPTRCAPKIQETSSISFLHGGWLLLIGMAPQQELVGARRILVLVGDSDIAKWPAELLPQWSESALPPTVSGHCGATLQEIIPHVETALNYIEAVVDTIILVVCAGENDIGNGLSRDDTLTALDELLQAFFGNTKSTCTHRRLIFLGPKLEPWLDNDASSRKQYVKLSRAFQRACSKHARADFVDCLTMFCGESANVPGATLGGKAKAEPMYFSSDQLHLNEEGYRIWKQVVEERLSVLSI